MNRDELQRAGEWFARTLPHTRAPLNSRNWGHGLHSLCSYQGKLKPAIAHILIREFTQQGETVLDPMAGAGTIPLEACIQGRFGMGNDLQELGYILTRAKTESGDRSKVDELVSDLCDNVTDRMGAVDLSQYADFGFNGVVRDYYSEYTYRQVLATREYMNSNPVTSWSHALVYACVLHILHGNRPYALSRRSHPVTPFAPSGEAEERDLRPRLREKVARSLSTEWPPEGKPGLALNVDLFELDLEGEVDAVVTSPPFAASTRFFSTNWMRLWMAGWEPADFETRREQFVEHQQRGGLELYRDFFERCAVWLRPGGRVIMHVGRNAKCNMGEELKMLAEDEFDLVFSVDEDVAGRENFGIRDQGGVNSHQYLFLMRRS